MVEWPRLEVEFCSVLVVQGESNFELTGLLPVLECGEGADVLPGVGLLVGVE